MDEYAIPDSPNNQRQSGAERRKHVRKVLRGTAQVLMAGRPPLMVRTLNISDAGMSIQALVNLPRKVACTIEFPLPMKSGGAQMIEVEAFVLHSIFGETEGGFVKVGLQFGNLSVEAATAIGRYLKD